MSSSLVTPTRRSAATSTISGRTSIAPATSTIFWLGDYFNCARHINYF
jgi:hypothetical protein